MKKQFFKKLVATTLSLSMLVSMFTQTIFAYDGYDEALVAELAGYSEEYPDGAFAFYNSQIEALEGDGSLYVDIVRMGGTEGEASVTFKAIDVSAVYGKDYTLSVDEGFFITRELEQDADAEPLMDLIAETTSEVVIGDEQTETEEAENVVEIGVSSEEGIVEINESFDEETDEDEVLEAAPEEEGGLRAAWSSSTGKTSNRKSWQEVTDSENSEAIELANEMSENNGYIDEFAQGLPGTEYTLDFDDGEYLKRIKIDLTDDDVSETDEQVMFVLMDEDGAEMAKPNTAYLNILDNDENEQVVFSLPDGAVTVFPEDGYAYVNVERISGIEKFASVTIATGAITAEPGKDYEAGSIEVIFPQGVRSRGVKVPIYDMNRAADVTFAVAIDTESAYADEATSSVAVTIKGNGEEAALEDTVLSLMSAEDSDETLELFASTESVKIKNSKVSSPNSGTDFGSYVTVAEDIDLRNATRIDVEYSTEGSYTYTYQVTEGSGCDKKTVNKTGTRTDKAAEAKIAGKTVSLPSNKSSVNINLDAKNKLKDQDFMVRVKRANSGNNGTVSYKINRITVHYEDIVIAIDNTHYDGYNIYTEKVFEAGGTKTENGMTYNTGNTILLGEGRVKGATSYTAKKYSEAVPFSISAPDANQKTTQDITPIEGKNVYLAGWQVYNPSSNSYDADIIRPDAMKLDTLYARYGHKTSFQLRPVIYPYSSLIRFNNSYADSLAYTNNIGNGKEIKVAMLDTLNITGVGINNSGYAVEKYVINGFYDTNLHGTNGTKRAENSDAVRKYNASQIKDYLNKNTKGAYKVNTLLNDADSSRIIIRPDCEAIYIDMAYTQPKIEVMYNPAGSAPTEHKEEGSVFYFDAETPENSAAGDWQTPMTIQPVSFGTLYNINAAYSDSDQEGVSKFKTVWQDFTGDMDRNGLLTQEEQNLLVQYKLDRYASTGDVFTYNPKVTNSLIYYYITERTVARNEGYIDGVVLLKDYPIFGSEDVTYTPLNDVAVTVDGITTATDNDENFGGIKGTGGDGYFSVSDRSFIAGEAHRVNLVYGPLSAAASQNVNVSQQYILDAYDTISVSTATRAKNGSQLAPEDLMYNDDADYTLTFVTKSSNSALVATKALLKFYRRDGTFVTEKEYSSTGELTGVFDCTFNPEKLGLPPGGKITVTFTDNQGTSYFEHDTGIILMQSLGALSLVTSFSGKGSTVLQVIGRVSSAFNFGWDGNLDDTSGTIGRYGNYSITTAEGKKVLNLGLEFATDGDVDSGGKTKEDVKAAAAADNKTSQGQQAKKETAKAVDNGKNKSKSDLAVGYSAEFTFGITLTLGASEVNLGEWYFEEFMIVINAGGSVSASKSFITPIGIPIIVGGGIGVNGQAIVVVERRLGSQEYYMANLMNDELGSVDLVNKGQSLGDYMYVYGDFTVAPQIMLSAGVGIDMFNIKLNGKADFSFNFNTKTDDNSGDVDFACWLSIKVILFTIDINLGSKDNVKLFSDSATLHESLDGFRVSEREHLANRGEWNGEGGEISLFAVSNMEETELLSGVNPNTDTQLAALDGGKYIAVFVDDVPERTAENSLGVYYSLYDGSSWSEPKIIHDDGTTDDSPVIHDLENGKLFIAWSSANQEFGEDPGLLDVLNSRNIQGVFVDKASGELGGIINVTNDTDDDKYADDDVHIGYDEKSDKMIIYYTKSMYEATDDDEESDSETLDSEAGVYGDVVYPYDTIAYRVYNMKDGDFIDMPDSPDGEWYGQVLLDLAPTVIVNETLDENGYWTEQPEITEYQGENDPIVIESDAISYNELSLFAYVLDYDSNKETTEDRDVFMQIYNFEEDSVSHPIMITSNDVEEKALQFERIGGGITFLSYLSDGEVKMFDVSSNISQETVTKEGTTSNGTPYYILDKSQDSGYIPEMVAVQKTGDGDYSGEQEIIDFDIRTGEKYFYVMFTERTTKLRDGIEPGSEEAALEENNLVETQIYMTRYDIEKGVLTNPVAVTEEEGANYANVAFAVTDNDGGFVAMATKSKSAVEEFDYIDFSTDGSNNSTLCAITFTPDANVTAENPTVENITAGGAAYASFEVYNGGLETIDGVTIEVSDADGNIVDISQIVTEAITLNGGERKEITFSVPVAEEANEAGFTAVVKDAEGNELDTITHSDSVARTLDVVSFNAEITERGVFEFDATVKNNATVLSGEKTFKVSAGEKELYTANIDSIKPGETKDISGEITFDYDEFFQSVRNEDGSVSADVVLTATAGNENLTDTLSLFASSEQMARMNAVTDVSFASKGTISLKKGEYFNLETTITADNYDGRFVDNNEEEIAAQGVTVKYMSDNEDVAKVYESGYIEGVSNGSATITALLMPADSTYDGVNYVSDYPTFPDEAIKTYTFTVKVGSGSSSRPSSGSRPSAGGIGIGIGTGTTYTVQLINLGDGVTESINVKQNSTIGEIQIPTRNGYKFAGWYTDEDLTTEADVNAKITANTTLYAKWVAAEADPDETGWINPFEDVSRDDWFYTNVRYAQQNGLMNGTADNLFSPNDDLTRGMLVTILYRSEGEPEIETASKFTDVPVDAYFADPVAWAEANGIVLGISDTEFAPDVQITREQIAAILYRYAVYKGVEAITMEENLHFDDAEEISEYAVSAMNWIVGQEIIKGYEDNTVRPQNNATRAEAATMLQRFIERLEAIAEAEAEVEETEVTE